MLETLPNDLTRMIYLASLRDCNSGMYLHPELSHQRGVHAADGALRACHEQVFRRLLTTRLAEYVNQLQEYIRYTRGETPDHAENLEVAAGLPRDGPSERACHFGGVVLPECGDRPGSCGQGNSRIEPSLVRRPAVG